MVPTLETLYVDEFYVLIIQFPTDIFIFVIGQRSFSKVQISDPVHFLCPVGQTYSFVVTL